MSQTYKSTHYALIEEMEKEHFWFAARNRMLADLTSRYIRPEGHSFLEVGFGTGIVLEHLAKLGFAMEGIDVNAEAVRIARERTKAKLYRRSLYSFKPLKRYDCVGAFDVLEHQTEDERFIVQCHAMLKPGGLLFLTVPALQSFWSSLDAQAGHKRRYEAYGLSALLEKAGFEILFYNYWQVLTTPFFLLWRMVSGRRSLAKYVQTPPVVLNRLFSFLARIEQRYFFSIHFPFGTSLVVVARKKRSR